MTPTKQDDALDIRAALAWFNAIASHYEADAPGHVATIRQALTSVAADEALTGDCGGEALVALDNLYSLVREGNFMLADNHYNIIRAALSGHLASTGRISGGQDEIWIEPAFDGFWDTDPGRGTLYTRKDKADAEIERLRDENKRMLAFIKSLMNNPISISEFLEVTHTIEIPGDNE